MIEVRLSLGINVSILLILTIFGVLLSLPLRLLFNTNYSRNVSVIEPNVTEALQVEGDNNTTGLIFQPIDYRKLKRCPSFGYKAGMRSVFISDYDRNCTYVRFSVQIKSEPKEKQTRKEETAVKIVEPQPRTELNVTKNETEKDAKDTSKSTEAKSAPVASHILVTMLVISAVAALVEVLRIRLSKDKHKDTSRGSMIIPRRSSVVDRPGPRRYYTKEPIRSQRSFENQGMHRSNLRLLGARPPPLIRRSSFPNQPAERKGSSSVGGTPINNRHIRRPSVETEEEIAPQQGTRLRTIGSDASHNDHVCCPQFPAARILNVRDFSPVLKRAPLSVPYPS